jgi:uncharacterized 2Fe-2S/4Fe-4S cluster protein (DUF4445 family)
MDDEGAILQSGVQSEIDLALITRKSLTEIAIDVGTTTLVASLLDMQTGACLGTAAEYNGQCAYGEDVLTRTLRALESDGAYLLQQAAMKTINGLIRKLCARIEIDNRDIAAVVIGANTIMVHLLLGFDPSRICREPFDGRRQYLIVVPASESVSGKNIVITQTDIDNIMRTKGAVNAAVVVLLESVGCAMEDVRHFFAAGAFGKHLDIESAQQLSRRGKTGASLRRQAERSGGDHLKNHLF